MNLRHRLSTHLHAEDIGRLATEADGRELYRLLFDTDKRTSDNAAWVLTHKPVRELGFMQRLQPELIDEAMRTTSTTKRRLILALLERQRFEAESIRTDFLDFCLALLMSDDAPTGIKSLAMKLAYKQCRHYPELLLELRSTLELMPHDMMSAGLRCARLNTLKKMNAL